MAAERKLDSRQPARCRAKTAKLGAAKMTPAAHQRRFIEAALEAGCREDEANVCRALGAIVEART